VNGHGEKLSRRREQAIAALLSQPTLEEAARAVGVGIATLKRWLQRADFRQAYRDARRQLLDDAIRDLQKAAGRAVKTLTDQLDAGGHVAVRSAVAVLDQSSKGTQVLDLAEEVAELRRQVQEIRQHGVFSRAEARGRGAAGRTQRNGTHS
jgi:hypothetical protein